MHSTENRKKDQPSTQQAAITRVLNNKGCINKVGGVVRQGGEVAVDLIWAAHHVMKKKLVGEIERSFIIKKIRSFTDRRILEFSLESVLKDERSSGSLGSGFREES